MQLLNLGIILTALAGLVTAAPPHQHKVRSQCSRAQSSSTQCFTRWGSSSVPWASSTSWSTHYTSCMSTSTVTSTVTTAPASTTTTSTITSTSTTTAPTSSFTSTVTSTATTLTTTTTTVTSTVTSTTSTSTTSTSTIAASSGFVPVQSSLAGLTYTGDGGADPVSKRSLSNNTAAGVSPNFQYPQGVTCQRYAQASCSVSTSTTTKTVQATSTGTVTSTSTSIVTSTIMPSATTTSTTTTTSTSTITNTATTLVTTTSTTTSTATTSVYAACATNNFADRYNGKIILSLAQNVGTANNADTSAVTTAYDCCVAAITDTDGGQVWVYNSLGFTTSGSCQVYNNGNQCAAQSDNLYTARYTTANVNGDIVAGNAYCGEINAAALL